MTAGAYFSVARRRWAVGVCAWVWLLHVVLAVPMPMLALAHADMPPWAGDVCTQGMQADAAPAAPAPDHSSCPLPLCCLLGCAMSHGGVAPPPHLPPVVQAAALPQGFARAGAAYPPSAVRFGIAVPRGPPVSIG